MRKFVLTLLAVLIAIPAVGGELVGVTMDDQVTVDGKSLPLNGMGLRKKAIIKVYVGGLYLESPQSDAKAVMAADTPRHMEMHFLYNVSGQKMCDAWNDGLEGNTPGASAALQSDFETLCGYMADMKKGERMSYTYVPGTGTTVNVQGSEQGVIEGKAFADALFACWIGPEPPSKSFRDGLLGK